MDKSPQDPLERPLDVDARSSPDWAAATPPDSLAGWQRMVDELQRPPTRRNVLIVDDDLTTREVLAELLETLGYSAAGVVNGKEALAYLKRNPPPDLILLDLKMPQMTGWAFRLELERDPALAAVPVVVCSGAFDAKAEAASLGAVDHLRKPVDPARLCSIVQRFCREPVA
jgi:two-component system response regulator MprA